MRRNHLFGVTLGALIVVYFLLFMSSPATPSPLWGNSFTFDLAEIVCMSVALAYLYEVIKAKQGLRAKEVRTKFEKRCLLYTLSGVALKLISTGQFVL